jgi:uncharacterized DUF497 family protein
MQEFEWDEEKASANLRKHGVSFRAATMVFSDPSRLTELDNRHYGQVQGRVIAVVHTEREGKIRVISARYADPSEGRAYYQLYPRSE